MPLATAAAAGAEPCGRVAGSCLLRCSAPGESCCPSRLATARTRESGLHSLLEHTSPDSLRHRTEQAVVKIPKYAGEDDKRNIRRSAYPLGYVLCMTANKLVAMQTGTDLYVRADRYFLMSK